MNVQSNFCPVMGRTADPHDSVAFMAGLLGIRLFADERRSLPLCMTISVRNKREMAADDSAGTRSEDDDIIFGIDDRPPLGQSVVLGIQHYLTMIGANIAVPLILADAMGMPPDIAARFIGTFFVVSGIATLAQTTFGNRYPIVQGAPFSMLAPALAIVGVVTTGGVGGATGWEAALVQLQGAIIVASVFEVAMGYFGFIGKLKRFLSPIVIAPTIALIGLSLFDAPQITGSNQSWLLLGLTLGLILLFSQYLDVKRRIFRLYPVVLAIGIAWILAAGLSVTGVFGTSHPGYVNLGQVTTAEPLFPIYPLQWGLPEFTPAFIIGMLAGILASIAESIGDYYAVANLTGSDVPSEKRINHGIGMEGLMNVFSGIMGTSGLTSYSENVGAIGLTGVASRYVVQIGAVVMLFAGFIGYFGQLIVTIPDPIVGGLFIAMFAQIIAVGLSSLRHADLDSSRNVFIVGFALFIGLVMPTYMGNFESVAAFRATMESVAVIGPVLGTQIIADTIYVVGSTSMAVGGLAALFLDNTIPGTREERGLLQWDQLAEDEEDFVTGWQQWFNTDRSE